MPPDVIIPKKVPLKAPAIILPNAGDLPLDCPCGSRRFHVLVRPLEAGAARLVELVCATCSKRLKADDKGRFGGQAHDHRLTQREVFKDGSN